MATSDLAKILESLDDKGDKYNIEASLENLNKSPDSNKGLVSFSKFVVLVEINKKTEDVEILDPAGEFPNSSDITQSQGQPSPPRVCIEPRNDLELESFLEKFALTLYRLSFKTTLFKLFLMSNCDHCGLQVLVSSDKPAIPKGVSAGSIIRQKS